MELDDKIYNKIINLCELGDSQVEKSEFKKALGNYLEALELIPNPKIEWEASTWIYTALGDTFYLMGNYENAKEYLLNGLNCPDGINPFILLRLGESFYELNNQDKAREYLLRAYMIEGNEIFKDEDEKYFKAITDFI